MFLVELVMQGVRGFRELARIRFQSGFNFVAAGNEAGKTTAVDAMRRLLFPSARPELMDGLISRSTPDASRAALVVFSDDGAYYRIIQDFSKRAVNLSKYNAATKDFALLHKDWDNAVQFMAGLTAGISEEDFSRVFTFRRDDYTDRKVSFARPAAPVRPVQPSKPAARPEEKTASNQAKLVELRETLRKSEEAADAEYKAQSAKLALDDVRKKLTALEELEQKKTEFDSTLEDLKGCEALPEELSELIEAYERLQAQKFSEAEGLKRELDGLTMQIASFPAVNLFRDKFFIAGAALLAASLFVGMFVLTSEQAFFFPISVVLSAGLMVTAWYTGARKNAQRKVVEREAEELEKEITQLDQRFEREGAAVKACLKTANAATVEELKDKADNYHQFLSLRAEIEEQRVRALGDRTPEALQEEYSALQQEALELGKAARALAPQNIDTYSIRQEIDRIESESSPEMPETAWDFGQAAQDLPDNFAAPIEGGSAAGFSAEIDIASRIGGIELETLVPAVEAAAQRNLASITGGKYVRIEVGQNGGPPIVHAVDDSIVNYAELSHGARDLVYFCLRTGLVEALAGKRRLPFILDDTVAAFDAARQKAASQILRNLGAKTQVILFSSNPALRAEGDAVAEFPS